MDHAKQAGAQLGLPWPDELIFIYRLQTKFNLLWASTIVDLQLKERFTHF